MSAPWNAEQREWLQAMGYDVLALPPQAGVAPPLAPAVRTAPDEAASPPVAAISIDAAAPLMQALRRAARCDTDAALVAEVMGIDGGLARLRTDPAAKRALWPRLRALRAKGLASGGAR